MARESFEDSLNSLFREEPEEHLRRLGQELREHWPPPIDRELAVRHWTGLISGAARALVATGQINGERARQLELEALRPLIDDNSITPVDVIIEESATTSATPDGTTGPVL